MSFHIPERTVIPSVRRLKDLDAALDAPAPCVLFTNVHIGNLADLARRVQERGKSVLVHADMIGGFRADREGIKLLRNMFRVDGILSQNSQVVTLAQKSGMWAVQRIFLMDSRSLEKGVQILREIQPHGIEVLPGALAAKYADVFRPWRSSGTLIAGGFITERTEVDELFGCGYQAITVSSPALWE
ncbi:glycerol-3-phosphate responsive antiterminator [Arcanobacterium haemolyticum]|nr:glycerol-3-phosphate responsive antiterminator [Arcanobacterium haemolyticum]